MIRFIITAVFCTILINLVAQTFFVDNKCLNEYRNDFAEASKDTCLISLTITNTSESGDMCNLPAEFAAIKNLYTLGLLTTKKIAFENTYCDFKCLYSVYVKGIINAEAFPAGLFLATSLKKLKP